MDRYRFSEQERDLLEGLQQPIAIYQFIDRRVVTLILSDGFCELFGYDDRALAYDDMDNDMYKDVHPDDVARISDKALRFATEGGEYEAIYRSRTMDRSGYRVIHAQGRHIFMEDGTRLAHVWYTDEGIYTGEDHARTTELNRALNDALHEESLLKNSYYDYLTGLPSMAYFFELAEAGKQAILQEGGVPALLFFDLNGMKFYNTKHGFAEGDRLLGAFAKLLVRFFSSENCCRISGDHFAAFTDEDGLEEKLDRLFAESRTINEGRTIPVRVGIYTSRMGTVSVSTACDRAKFACDSIRKTYDSAFNYYDQSLRDDLERQRHILSTFDRALEERWIKVHYQPIVRSVTGRVCDEEALARWYDPEQGLLSPAEFIPHLEEEGQIYKLDLYVLDRVLEKIKTMDEAGFFLVPQSINLSRSDFSACDIVEEIRRKVDEAGIERRLITIEITESIIGDDLDFMKEQVERFQNLGFSVWMDDFGSGYSSLEVLQSIRFDVIKFDMSFMQRFDEGDNGKIILTELMRMTTALGVDTVCEGVETEEQVRFLQEIGCSMLQGYYFVKPIPMEKIIERYEKGIQIGFENQEEMPYYETLGRVNLYNLSMISREDERAFQNYYDTLPMAVLELRGGESRFVRCNQSYREFMNRMFGFNLSEEGFEYSTEPFRAGASFMKTVLECCKSKSRSFIDERMPDGSVVHSFVRWVGDNPVTGATAVAVAVLTVADASEGTTYASIARALAADYYNLYYVDLQTDQFIEYRSPVGGEEMAKERHGEDFFASARRDTMVRIFEKDRKWFLNAFTKENILGELEKQGVFTLTYRLIDTGEPMYVTMKAMPMQQDKRHLIIGISIIDSQMRKKEESNTILRDRDTYNRIMALAGDYISIYIIDPETGRYREYSSTDEYDSLGLDKEGEDFFRQSVVNIRRAIWPEDLPGFLEKFSRDRVMEDIRMNGTYQQNYRLIINGEPVPVTLKIASVKESDGDRLIAGVRAWKDRK